MSSRTDHEQYEELAVGHALNALEPGDEVEALEHLRTCDSCRRLTVDTMAVMAEMAVLAPPVEPPAELGQRIRAAVALEPRGAGDAWNAWASPRTANTSAPAPRSRPAAPRPAAAPRGGRPGRGPAGRRVQRAVPWLLTAAAIAALAVVTGWSTSISADRDQLARTVALREQVLDRLADPDAQVVRLAPQEGSASAAVLLDESRQAYVVVDGLDRNDVESDTYVLWQVPEGGAPQAVGVFDVTADGVQVAQVGAVTLGPDRLAALAVSREAGRVAPPTPSTPLLVGTPA